MLSITTDYADDTGNPEPYLRRIAEAGFSCVHWCHHWNTDFLYSKWEIQQIAKWLDAFGLRLLDLHASAGVEKSWASPREYERLSGLELVENRIEMAASLAGNVIIMHIPAEVEAAEGNIFWTQLRKSLDALKPFAGSRNVRIAIENGNFDLIKCVFAEYGPDYLGLCYDAGHGNLDPKGLRSLESLKDRLISIHLHDNDGNTDQHKLLFTGTVDWPRLARILALSSYKKCVSMEVLMQNSGIEEERAFLEKAYETGTTFAGMIRDAADREGE